MDPGVRKLALAETVRKHGCALSQAAAPLLQQRHPGFVLGLDDPRRIGAVEA